MKKNSILLSINTSDTEEIIISLTIDGKIYEKRSQSRREKAQALLSLIYDELKEQGLTIQDVTEIKVHTGPGSFTGLRVGVSVANTLGWSLGLPVNGKTGTIVLPVYSRDF